MESEDSHCLTCFQPIEGDCYRANNPEIWRIITKHLWFQDSQLQDAFICISCWATIDTFHQFYTRVEELYETKDEICLKKGLVNEGAAELVQVEVKGGGEEDGEGEQEELEIKEEVDSDQEQQEIVVAFQLENEEREEDEEPEEQQEDEWKAYSESEEDNEDSMDVVSEEQEEVDGESPDQVIRTHIVLKCEDCGSGSEEFTFKELFDHRLKKHGVKKAYVECCGIHYHTRIRLLEHVQHLMNPYAFKCEYCVNKLFSNSYALRRHLRRHHAAKIPKQNNGTEKEKPKPVTSEEKLKLKEAADNRRQDRQAEDAMMREHIQFGCVPCGTTFDSYGELFTHSRVKHKQKPKISCCGHNYDSRARLLQHVQSVNNPVAFRCDMCFRCFRSEYARKNHVKQMHPTEESLKYKCDRCPKVFVREIKYKQHLKDHEDVDKGEIKCEQCGKEYTSRHILYMHIRNKHQEPRFVCDICAKPFRLQSEFKRHKIQHEDPDQLKMQCQHCLKWFKHRGYWRAHVRKHVVGEVSCDVCGRVCPSKDALRSHKKNTHGERNIKCDWCEKLFLTAQNLREHVASKHTGESLYTCTFCPKTFNSSANMASHRKKTHPVEWQAMRDEAATRNMPTAMAEEVRNELMFGAIR